MNKKKVAIVAGTEKYGAHTIGNAIREALSFKYDVITVGRYGGDIEVEISRGNYLKLLDAIVDKLDGRHVALLVNSMATNEDDLLIEENLFPYTILYDVLTDNGLFGNNIVGFQESTEPKAHSVINIGGLSAYMVGRGKRNHTILKAAIDGFTKSIAAQGVRCNTISPDRVMAHYEITEGSEKEFVENYPKASAWNPLGKVLMAKDVAEVVVMVDNCAAINGQNILVDYGHSIVQKEF